MAARRRRFRFEQLETRRMRAADILFDDATGVLEIHGAGGNDVAEVAFDGNEVEVRLTYADGSDTEQKSRDEAIAGVRKIVFYGYDGGDEMLVTSGQLDSGVSISNIRIEFYGSAQEDTFDNLTRARSYAYGGEGNDTLLGGSSIDYLYGEQGNDTLDGRAGNDYYVFAGANLGSDTITEAVGQGTMDRIDLRDFTLTNGAPDDYTVLDLSGAYQQTVYRATNGQHFKLTIVNPEALEVANGTSADDYFLGNSQTNYFYGYEGDDWLQGNDGDDYLYGYGDNDFLWGGKGADRLYGYDGDDLLFGDEYSWQAHVAWLNTQDASGGQIDILDFTHELMIQFEATDEQLLDDAFHSVLEADEDPAQFGARDYLYAGYGDDVAYGGSGNDYVAGEHHDDFLIGGLGDDDLYGDNEYTSSQGVDYLFGGSGADDLFGYGMNDWLLGGNDKDTLDGGEGDDLIYGRYDGETDVLKGGAGRDTFIRYWRWENGGGWVEDEEEDETDFTPQVDTVGLARI